MISLIGLIVLGSLLALWACLNTAATYDTWAEAQYKEYVGKIKSNHKPL